MSDKRTRFIPVKPDRRRLANIFQCVRCGGEINDGWSMKELDYNFCPWCGAEREDEEGEENE